MSPTATIIENLKIKNLQIEECRVFRGLICEIYLQIADTVPIAHRPLPRQKSTKIESKTACKLSSIGRRYYRYREDSREGPTRYRVFLQRKYLDSIWEHSELLSR